jgi:hypothetical protein
MGTKKDTRQYKNNINKKSKDDTRKFNQVKIGGINNRSIILKKIKH